MITVAQLVNNKHTPTVDAGMGKDVAGRGNNTQIHAGLKRPDRSFQETGCD